MRDPSVLHWIEEDQEWLFASAGGPAGSARLVIDDLVLDFDRCIPGRLTLAVIPRDPGPRGQAALAHLLGPLGDPPRDCDVELDDAFALALARIAVLSEDARDERARSDVRNLLVHLELGLAIATVRAHSENLADLLREESNHAGIGTLERALLYVAEAHAHDVSELLGAPDKGAIAVQTLIHELSELPLSAHSTDERKVLHQIIAVLDANLGSTRWHPESRPAPGSSRARSLVRDVAVISPDFVPSNLKGAFTDALVVQYTPAEFIITGHARQLPSAPIAVEISRPLGSPLQTQFFELSEREDGSWQLQCTLVDVAPSIRVVMGDGESRTQAVPGPWDYQQRAIELGQEAFVAEREGQLGNAERWARCAHLWQAAGAADRAAVAFLFAARSFDATGAERSDYLQVAAALGDAETLDDLPGDSRGFRAWLDASAETGVTRPREYYEFRPVDVQLGSTEQIPTYRGDNWLSISLQGSQPRG